jgi:DNA-binding MarR family transcriptional regulator
MSSLGDLADSSVLALAASGAASVARIDAACQLAAGGKLAARDIAGWLRGFQVTEPEFRLLWLLSQSVDGRPGNAAFDQAELAELLVVSPAQVSGAVERLRSLGMLDRVADQRDRRRQLWRLADGGRELLAAVVASVADLGESHGRRIPPLTPPFEGAELLEGAA